MSIIGRCAVMPLLYAALSAGAADAQAPRQVRVSFTPGASSSTVTGTVKGYNSIDYVLRAAAGQTMHVVLKTSHGGNSFNVLPPGSDAAIAMGEMVGNDWTGQLPLDGDYRVRVFLPRAAARRNESATFSLSIGITGRRDPMVAGTPFHATSIVPCSVGPDPKESARCSVGVIRGGGGRAQVHVVAPGYDVKVHKDQVRVLHFDGGRVTSADASEKVTVERRGDDWLVAVNGFYFYTIPDAVIIGG